MLTGISDGTGEHDAVIAAIAALPVRPFIEDQLLVLPTASPYRISAEWADDGIHWQGFVSSAADQARLADKIGSAEADSLTIAAGAPDGEWTLMAELGQDALTFLASGSFEVEGRHANLEGIAETLIDRERAEAVLSVLPEGYTAHVKISLAQEP